MKSYRVTYSRQKQSFSSQVQLDSNSVNFRDQLAQPFTNLFDQCLASARNSIQLWLIVTERMAQPRKALVNDGETLADQLKKLNFRLGDFAQFQWVDLNQQITVHLKASAKEKVYQISAPKQMRIDHMVVHTITHLGRPLGPERPSGVKFELMFTNQDDFSTIDPSLCPKTPCCQVKAVRILDERINSERCYFTINIGGREATVLHNPKTTLESVYHAALIATSFIPGPPCQAVQYGKPLVSMTFLREVDPLEPIYFEGNFCYITLVVELAGGPTIIRKPVPADWSLENVIDQLFFDPTEIILSDYKTAYAWENILITGIDWNNWCLSSCKKYEPVVFQTPEYAVELLVYDRTLLSSLCNDQGQTCHVLDENGRTRVILPPGVRLQASERLRHASGPPGLEILDIFSYQQFASM